MKRLVLAAFLVAFAASCTPESTSEELENNGFEIQATEKENSTNTNGSGQGQGDDNGEG